MADQDQDELVAQLIGITTCSPEDARALLEASSWSLQDAVELFYASGDGAAADDSMADDDEPEDDDDDFEPPTTLQPTQRAEAASAHGLGRTLDGGIVGAKASGSTTPQSRSDSAAGKQKKTGGLMTLGDLKNTGGDAGHAPHGDDDDDDEDQHDFFAGGEKSGLAVENPNKRGKKDSKNGDKLIKDILKRAEAGSKARRDNPPDDEDEGQAKPRFTGQGQTLGSDEVQSTVIPDPHATNPQKLAKVTRRLTFWKNGFSIEDGPLMRYDDPQHRATLQSIEAGRAPLHLMNVEPGQPTDVHVYRKMDEDYSPPVLTYKPFGGSGQRLGAPTPGGLGQSSSSSFSAPAAAALAASSSAAPPRTVDIDQSAPVTSIQIRLGDGTRLVSKFNHTHTVADIYAFVNAANTESRTRSYVLQTTFPNRELKDHTKTVKDEQLINAVVVQKWT